MFGLGQIYSLFLKQEDDAVQAMENSNKPGNQPRMGASPGANPMMNPMNPMMPMQQQADPNQKRETKDIFKNQIESLSLVQHHFAYDSCTSSATARLMEFLAE